MFQNDVSRQYKENSIYTMSPEELTLMLYNGLIKFLMKAEEAINEKKFDSASVNIIRAEDIINEFMITLDMKYDVSKGLMLMYDYMYRRLVEANLKKNCEMVVEVIEYAKELRDTWQAAMKIAKTGVVNKPLEKIAK
jgi:flagellar protein FliS